MGVVGVLSQVGARATVGFAPKALHFEGADGHDFGFEMELTARERLGVGA